MRWTSNTGKIFFRSCRTQISIIVLCCYSFVFFVGPVGPGKAHGFTISEEKKIGDKLLSMIRSNYDLLEETDISQYINNLGHEILSVAGPQFFEYNFFVINDQDFNAFAAPSGLIFIHTGLIEAMEDEGELISVMAHECAHITSRHIADQIKKSQKTSIGTAALLLAGIALGGGALSEALITGSMAANAAIGLRYSRQDEEEADRLAFRWMTTMKIDPINMASMLQKMHRISIYQMTDIPPYLLTHPEPKDRLGYVQDLLAFSTKSPSFKQRDNFNFHRIKERILALSKKPALLRNLALARLKKENVSEEYKSMARYSLCLAYLEEADYSKAEAELAKVIAAYPDKAILLADQAIIDIKTGKYNKALHLLQQAIKKKPTDSYIKFHLAQTWQHLGQPDQALSLYKSLLVTHPNHPRLHYQISQIKNTQQQTGASHYHLGLYFWFEGKERMALLHLKKAIESKDTPALMKEKAEKFSEKIRELEKM